MAESLVSGRRAGMFVGDASDGELNTIRVVASTGCRQLARLTQALPTGPLNWSFALETTAPVEVSLPPTDAGTDDLKLRAPDEPVADLLRVVAVPPYGVTLTVTREPIREHAARYHLCPATLVPDFTKTRPAVPLIAGYVPDVTYDGNCAALGWVLSGPETTLGLPPLNLATAMFPRVSPSASN